jgi:hypothetical protein
MRNGKYRPDHFGRDATRAVFMDATEGFLMFSFDFARTVRKNEFLHPLLRELFLPNLRLKSD